MKRFLPLILILVVVLCIALCVGIYLSGDPQAPTTPSQQTTPSESTGATDATTPTQNSHPETTEPTNQTTSSETEPTEPQYLYFNPFTGEGQQTPFTARPFLISLGNTKTALPHMGTMEADIVFEMLANGGVTRCLALITDVENLETFGSIRSLRYNFTDIAQAYDGIIVYASASGMVLSDLANSGVNHLNAVGGNNGGAFYRDQNRLDAGYPREHTLFANIKLMVQLAQKRGFAVTTEENKDYGLQFAKDGTPADGATAQQIKLSFFTGNKPTTLKYDAATQRYTYHQYGMDMVDGSINKPESFKNVFVLNAQNTNDADGYHVLNLLGEGDGYYACGGKIVPVKWHRETESDPFTYTLADGTPLVQGVGNSYVAFIPAGSAVSYS